MASDKNEKLWVAFGAPRPFDPENRYVTSYFLTPRIIFLCRAIIAVYITTTLIICIVQEGGPLFSYFTYLSLFGLWGYYTASALHTFSFLQSLRRTTTHTSGAPIQPTSSLSTRLPRSFQLLHATLFSSIAILPLLVTVVFWGLIADKETLDSTSDIWRNISIHALNTVYCLLEIFVFTRVGIRPWIHLLAVAGIVASYLGIAYITHATEHFWTYSFLDPSRGKGKLVAYIFGIALAVCILFCIVQFFLWLKIRIFETKWGWSAKGVPAIATDPTIVKTREGDERGVYGESYELVPQGSARSDGSHNHAPSPMRV